MIISNWTWNLSSSTRVANVFIKLTIATFSQLFHLVSLRYLWAHSRSFYLCAALAAEDFTRMSHFGKILDMQPSPFHYASSIEIKAYSLSVKQRKRVRITSVWFFVSLFVLMPFRLIVTYWNISEKKVVVTMFESAVKSKRGSKAEG